MEENVLTKKCKKCGMELPISEFTETGENSMDIALIVRSVTRNAWKNQS